MKKKYYHLSRRAGLNVLSPMWTDRYTKALGEAIAQRVCVSSSIIGCIRGLDIQDTEKLYVYTVIVDDTVKFIPNKYVQYLVPDADYTKEAWLMQDMRSSCLGIIEASRNKWKWIERW